MGLVALVPWLLALRRARLGEAGGLAALLAIAHGVLLAPWIPNALQHFEASPVRSHVGLVVVCAVVGLPMFIGPALLARFTARLSTQVRVLVFAAVIFATDWWLLTASWTVPWALLGYSQLGLLGVAQLAVVGGVPLISALLMALQVAIADSMVRRKRASQFAIALFAAWLALAAAGLPVAETWRPIAVDHGSVNLLLVQPNLPRSERWGDVLQPLNLYRVRTFADRAIAENSRIDALILPENLLTARVDASRELGAALAEWIDGLGVPVLSGLVLSAVPPRPELYRSSVVWLERGRGISARLDKERAIPLIESGRRALGDSLLASVLGPPAEGPKVEEVPNSGPLHGPISVTPLLCYEVLFPELAALRRGADSVAIVNLADDSWVEGESATRHLTNLARFRAIEQRLALVRVAHGGLSVVADAYGRVLETLPRRTYTSRRVELRPSPPPTLRERAAIFALPLGAFAVVGWSWTALRRIAFARRMGVTP